MRISDWSSDVCSSDLLGNADTQSWYGIIVQATDTPALVTNLSTKARSEALVQRSIIGEVAATSTSLAARAISTPNDAGMSGKSGWYIRSEEHTSELQSLMRISYAVFCLKKKKHIHNREHTHTFHI